MQKQKQKQQIKKQKKIKIKKTDSTDLDNRVLSLLKIEQVYNILNQTVDGKFRRNSINFLSHIPLSHIPLSDITKDQDHKKPFENIKYFAHKQQVENLIKEY